MPASPARTLVKVLGALLGLSAPALLIAALWMWDWRWAATGAITGLTALALMGALAPPKNAPGPPPPRPGGHL